MRPLLLLFSLFVFSNSFGQTTDKYAVFKIEDFQNLFSKHKISIQKLEVDSLIDLEFYKKHFYIPYYFPNPTINKLYNDTIVVIWRDTSAKRDYKSNWTHSYKYDNKSRVIEYTFSGCFICSQLPYTMNLLYDSVDRVIQMNEYLGLRIPGKNGTESKPIKVFKIYYDQQSNIIKLESFLNDQLNQRITKT